MQVVPYIFFYGRCEEALAFYKSALGGTYEVMRVKDAPADVKEQMPPGVENSVMHASFQGDGFSFLCADGREVKAVDPDAGNVDLSITAADAGEAERVFKALSDGGKVMMPLGPAFWGGTFGMVVDKFGTEWMITAA